MKQGDVQEVSINHGGLLSVLRGKKFFLDSLRIGAVTQTITNLCHSRIL